LALDLGYGNEQSSGSSNASFPSFEFLLSHLQAERILAESLYPTQYTILKTDIKDTYLELNHNVILIVFLKLGIPKQWVEFFKSVLHYPVGDITDSKAGFEAKTARRGAPLGLSITTLIQEIMLVFIDVLLRKEQDKPGTPALFSIRLSDDRFQIFKSEKEAQIGYDKEIE
jgi:hypothetical protein